MFLDRLLIVMAVAAAVTTAMIAVRLWNTHRVRRLLAESPAPLWTSLGEQPDGRHALVTFSTPSCAACHTAQAPAVSAVQDELGSTRLRVIEVDAAERPDVARVFGVLTVPSTVVLAPAGQIVAVNQGFAPTRKLIEQLQSA